MSPAAQVRPYGLREHPVQMGAGNPAGDFSAEARFGLEWLLKAWDDRRAILYYQVGIGDGNGCGSICGDHDIWRLPQADDTWPGGARFRYIRDRPALRAGPAGANVSPNLAGRLAAAFALCSETYRVADPALASRCLSAAEHVYGLAGTRARSLLRRPARPVAPDRHGPLAGRGSMPHRSASTLLVALLALLVLAGPAHAARTTVTIQFDDGRQQTAARKILQRHHMHATFFVNAGYVGTADYFTWKQLHQLAADGNEITGHTLTHRDLATLSRSEQQREICGDRSALLAHGFKPVNFAYPFGSFTPVTERVVQSCGYSSGRHAWGLWGSGCEAEPATCPYAIDPQHPADP